MNKAQWAGLMLSAAGLLVGTTSQAEGFYFGISGGVSSVDLGSRSSLDAQLIDAADDEDLDVEDLDSSLDDSGTVWGLQVGYEWNAYVAAELGYIDLGHTAYKAAYTLTDGVDSLDVESKVRFTSTGVTLAVLGMLPIGDRFDVHAKAGVYFSDTRIRVSDVLPELDERSSDEVKDSDKDLFAGVGATFNFNADYAVRAQYQRFFDVGGNDTGEEDVDVFTLSVLFR